MATIGVEHFGDDALRKLYLDLVQKDDWDDDCELCRMPTLLHSDTTGKRIHGACTRRTELTEADILNEWTLFRKKMKPIRNLYTDDMEKKQTKNDIVNGFNSIKEALIEGTKGRTNKLVKPAKVPSWSKGMQLKAYKNQ